jgi:CRISPR-associated exonuclease Cas4
VPDADHDNPPGEAERDPTGDGERSAASGKEPDTASDRSRATVAFSDLAIAAYCPRQLYYARRDDREPPAEHRHARELAGRYAALTVASDTALATYDLGVEPPEFRSNLAASLDRYPGVAHPTETAVFVRGKDTHGRAAKVHDGPLSVSVVTPGSPPEAGVWEPQAVRAVAVAKALAWREETPVDHAYVEYARHGVVRRVELTTRRKAAYRRALRTVRALDGPPPRLHDDAKCGACEYSDECGAKTRTLGSLLSLGGG